jgi:hypothetical protein
VRVPNASGANASLGLSIIFNEASLAAYSAGASYFYLVNDDLKLITDDWTPHLIWPLTHSALGVAGFGLSGALDVSSVQPFVEFPFYHRTHITVFQEMGANPWIFHNW